MPETAEKMRPTRILLVFVILIVFSSPALAARKTFVRDYTYEASELDDRVSCQSIALEQVKRLLLEELGTYVESVSTVKNYELDHDEITTLTAGIVQTKILQESWDGTTYRMKARLSADTDEVAEAIAQLKDNRQIVNDLQEARQEAYDALVEVERLKSALAKDDAGPEQKARYEESIRRLQATDFLERGQSHLVAGEYEEAAEAYSQVVALRPGDAKGYGSLAVAYVFLGNYRGAVTNLNRAVRLNPGNRHLAMNRNIAQKMLSAPQKVTPRERNLLTGADSVRVYRASRPPVQATVAPYRPALAMKQERPGVPRPREGAPGSYPPTVQPAQHQQPPQGSAKPASPAQQTRQQQTIQRQPPPQAVSKLPVPGQKDLNRKPAQRRQPPVAGKPATPPQQAIAGTPQVARQSKL